LFSYIRGVNMIKYRKKSMAYGILTVHNLYKLIEALLGRSIVFEKSNNRNPRSTYRFE